MESKSKNKKMELEIFNWKCNISISFKGTYYILKWDHIINWAALNYAFNNIKGIIFNSLDLRNIYIIVVIYKRTYTMLKK